MELRRLQYFLAVAEELSFTRAAERLNMAQPPLSTQIRALESELGVSLFDRSRRAISLTAAGRALVPEARRVLDGAEQAARIARRAGDGTVGRLMIGFVPSAAHGALPAILPRYRQRYPGVELSMRERTPDELIRLVHERRLDVALMFAPLRDDTLFAQCVCTEHLVAAVPRHHALAREASVDVRVLAAHALILPTQHETPGLYSRIRELFDEFGIDPVVVQREIWMMQTIIGLVAADIGVAIVPSSATTLRHPDVVYRPLAQRAAPVEMTAIWRKDTPSPTLAGFIEIIRERTHDIPAPTPAPG